MGDRLVLGTTDLVDAGQRQPLQVRRVAGVGQQRPLAEGARAVLAAAVEPGGYLLYTNQPWHPQQEMIARVLPNRDGEPWVMRCRTQAEMDQLVVAAGFEKVRMLIDNDGIFSVSMAVKR